MSRTRAERRGMRVGRRALRGNRKIRRLMSRHRLIELAVTIFPALPLPPRKFTLPKLRANAVTVSNPLVGQIPPSPPSRAGIRPNWSGASARSLVTS